MNQLTKEAREAALKAERQGLEDAVAWLKAPAPAKPGKLRLPRFQLARRQPGTPTRTAMVIKGIVLWLLVDLTHLGDLWNRVSGRRK